MRSLGLVTGFNKPDRIGISIIINPPKNEYNKAPYGRGFEVINRINTIWYNY